MGDDELKTSSEWEAELGILVLDPDGWDRRRLPDSWAEFITRAEFNARLFSSTFTTDLDWGRTRGT